MKGIEYKGVFLASGSKAYELYTDKKFKELDQHLKQLDRNLNELIQRYG